MGIVEPAKPSTINRYANERLNTDADILDVDKNITQKRLQREEHLKEAMISDTYNQMQFDGLTPEQLVQRRQFTRRLKKKKRKKLDLGPVKKWLYVTSGFLGLLIPILSLIWLGFQGRTYIRIVLVGVGALLTWLLIAVLLFNLAVRDGFSIENLASYGFQCIITGLLVLVSYFINELCQALPVLCPKTPWVM